MKSANQLYKESGSNLPFKEWLIEEQKKGELDIHDRKAFINATGENDILMNKPTINSMVNKNKKLVIGLGIVLIGFGAYNLIKNKS